MLSEDEVVPRTVRETVWTNFKFGVQTLQVPDGSGGVTLRRVLRLATQDESEVMSFMFPYAQALEVGRGLSVPHVPTASPGDMEAEIRRQP